MFLLRHVLEKVVTDISNVVVWKSTGTKIRENVELHHVLENQETDISNGCGLKKYRKMFSLRHVLEKQLTDISNVVVWKGTEKCFIKSCTRKTSN